MSKIKLSLRRARAEDSRLFWRWRNEPSVVRNSFSAERIPWAVHQKWFAARIANPKSHLFVLESQRKPVGQVRLDVGAGGTAEIHVVLDKAARGRGFGAAGLSAAAKRMLASGGVRAIVAHVKPENLPSVVAFLKAGFLFRKMAKVKGVACYEFVRERP